jgi:hypothetical protein
MYRAICAFFLVLAFLILGFASLSYVHLRQFGSSTNFDGLFEQVDVQVITTGLTVTKAGDAGRLFRNWQNRVFILFGVGIMTLLFSATMLLQKKRLVEQ